MYGSKIVWGSGRRSSSSGRRSSSSNRVIVYESLLEVDCRKMVFFFYSFQSERKREREYWVEFILVFICERVEYVFLGLKPQNEFGYRTQTHGKGIMERRMRINQTEYVCVYSLCNMNKCVYLLHKTKKKL